MEDPVALSRALGRRGFAVRTMTTAVEALRWVADNQPDVIVRSLGLSDIDGCMAIRLFRAVTDVPVIVAGCDDETSAADVLDAGAEAYITIPVVVELLVARIAALLRWVARLWGTGQPCGA